PRVPQGTAANGRTGFFTAVVDAGCQGAGNSGGESIGRGPACAPSRGDRAVAMASATKTIPADSVGLVSPQKLHFDQPLTLRSGRVIEQYDLMVETYGTLNADS